jgi:hypothetical protein
MRAALWAGLLALAMMAGCLGGVDPAEISEQTLNQKGWSQTNSDTQPVAMGLAEIATKEYRGPSGQDATGVTVATTNDIPILDERRFIPNAIEKIEEKRGITLEKTGTTKVSLPQLGGTETDADVYDFEKSGAQGKAVLITPEECDPFVISVGYGLTQGSELAGSATYNEAKDVARNVAC